MKDQTQWMTASDLADRLGLSLKTVKRRAGRTVGECRYESRPVASADDVHHLTKTLYRVVSIRADVTETGDRLWPVESRRPGTQDDTHLRETIARLEQQVADLKEAYRQALKEKHAASRPALLEAVLSALGGVGEDDMREILSQAVRDHMIGEVSHGSV